MGLERRGNGTYYYRKVRRDGRVVSEYLGQGVRAAVEAWRVESVRANRLCERESREDVEARLDAEEAEAIALFDAVESVAREVLLAAGYHRHKRGEWRKRRGNDGSIEGEPNRRPEGPGRADRGPDEGAGGGRLGAAPTPGDPPGG